MEKHSVKIECEGKSYEVKFSMTANVNVSYCIEFEDQEGIKKFGKEYCFETNPDGLPIATVNNLNWNLINGFLAAIKI